MTDGTCPADPSDLSYVESFSPGRGFAPARASQAAGSVQLSLNGTWKFRYCESPRDLTQGFKATDSDDSRFDDIAVPSCWQLAGIPGPPRCAGRRRLRLSAPVGELATRYVRPQENGNRMHARSLTLTGDAGQALTVTGDPPFDFAVRRWSPELLTAARHTPDLIPDGRTHLHLDAAHHGIGSASCGPPLPPGHSLAARTVAWTLRFSA